ncbi:MAG: pyridoxal phosphate-dependent aminotransferase [Thermodesulfobacteriota bacterium]|nr:MAG: pyridoxal phosphate-dependent aminotransferase [Thermodesulfobacteriota bacterium]
MIRLSRRLDGLEESVTLAITARAKALKAAGRDVVGFGAGEPDFDTPDNIKDAAIRAIREGRTKYTPVAGLPELKDAVIEKFKRDNNLDYSRDEIIVSCGGKHSLYNLFNVLLNEGDEVVIPAPYWVSYPAMVKLAGGTPVIVNAAEGQGFKITPGELSSSITGKTRAVIINSPSNPTGAAYTAEELAGLAETALEKDVLIISDEIYEKITYDGFSSSSIATVSEEVRKKTVIVNGVSKAYSMTGWRIGYTAGPVEIIKAMGRIQSQSTSNPCSISQWAAIEALRGPQDSVEAMVREFSLRRDAMVKALNSIDGVKCPKPQGAFYVFPDCSEYFKKSFKGGVMGGSVGLAAYLLDEAGVAVVPGIAFGEDRCLRLSYAIALDNITKGVKRIKEALESLE